jgi:hypothetical protein
MPVRSWASTLASFHDNQSYSCRVCLPGRAASTLFTCLPTFSGRPPLLVSCWDRAMLRVVDFILGSCMYGIGSSWVAALACTLARPNSLLSSLVETQRIVILFPFFRSLLISLYIRQTCSWPDCCRGFPRVSAATLLLVSRVILYSFSTSSVFNACAIAANSPKYGFCSDLAPSVTEKAFSLGFLYLGGCF